MLRKGLVRNNPKGPIEAGSTVILIPLRGCDGRGDSGTLPAKTRRAAAGTSTAVLAAPRFIQGGLSGKGFLMSVLCRGLVLCAQVCAVEPPTVIPWHGPLSFGNVTNY